MTDFDVETTKMMMRKFMQMEKQFKEAAYFAVFGIPQFIQPPPVIQQEDVKQEEKSTSSEKKAAEISPTVADFESMGKIDVPEVSAAQLRRKRRSKLERKYQIMRRGRFWEINELQKEGGL